VITALDHVAIAVRDVETTADAYRRLLGVEPDREDGDGAARAWFRFPNMALEIIGPQGDGGAGDRVRQQLDDSGEGVWLLAFATGDLEAAAKLLERRGVGVERIGGHVRLDRAQTGGLQTFLRHAIEIRPSRANGAEPVTQLDHVVVLTPNVDRALAIYGAKLGLDLRLDRENPKWNARQLFFRVGGTVIEMGAKIGVPPTDEPDSSGGLAWRVADPDAAQARMAAAGFDVSEVRAGRKPGTKVFTVRDAPGGVPTLMLSAEPAMETA
jgi:catechol 2,3-dioxygenase-like lactoylglutathione lyase family enzyme